MNALSPPARRYILEILVMGALVAMWELSSLEDGRLELFTVLLLHVSGTFFFRHRRIAGQVRGLTYAAPLAAGLLVLCWQMPHLRELNYWVLLALGGMTAVTNILKHAGPTSRSSYQVSFIVYGFALALLGSSAAIMIIIIAHVLERTWSGRYRWYIRWFNVATFVLSTSAAGLVFGPNGAAQTRFGIQGMLRMPVAFVAFVFVNHFLVGLVLKTAHGQSFRESGVFRSQTLMIDFSLLCMGGVAAQLWWLHPYASFLTIIPLYLVYHALRIPALERQAESDPKTGLYNSSRFERYMEEELARAHRFNRPLTLVMGDMDLLRNVNNTYGHLAGDAVIKGIARLLHEMTRDFDVVARFGGEEFVVLMPETRPSEAGPMIETMRQAIADTVFTVSSSAAPIRVTMSFGIAGRANATETADDLIHQADQALYQAKRAGRNKVVVYGRAEEEASSTKVIAEVEHLHRGKRPAVDRQLSMSRWIQDLPPLPADNEFEPDSADSRQLAATS